jgi:hypothetical protein
VSLTEQPVSDIDRLRNMLAECLPSVRQHHRKRLAGYLSAQRKGYAQFEEQARLRAGYLDNLERRICQELGLPVRDLNEQDPQ